MTAPHSLPHHSPLVLVVDDSETTRTLTRRMLERSGYRVVDAADGLNALRVLGEVGLVDAVVSDIDMPGMDGQELAACLAILMPKVPILFMSGFDPVAAGVELPGPVLAKPFRADQLAEEVRRLLQPARVL
jgi:two-component system, cell cycle sensor histidine kinase and response regulator CckA